MSSDQGGHGQVHLAVPAMPVVRTPIRGCPTLSSRVTAPYSRVLEAPGTSLSAPMFGLAAWSSQETGSLYSVLDAPLLGISEAVKQLEKEYGGERVGGFSLPLKITMNAPHFRSTVEG